VAVRIIECAGRIFSTWLQLIKSDKVYTDPNWINSRYMIEAIQVFIKIMNIDLKVT